MNKIRKALRVAMVLLFRLLTRSEVFGLENLPSQGGILLASNHMSRIDPPLIFALLERQDATALVADKYQRNPFMRWLVNSVGGIWLNREEADIDALRVARSHLKGGGLLGIAPEGTRSRVGALIRAKTGAAYLADKAGVPVLPAAITGTDDAFRQLLRLRRPRISIRFGEPFHLPPVERRSREQDLQRNTDEIMCRIAAMLPEKYWGYYAGHPRLKELLGEKAPPFQAEPVPVNPV